MTLHQTFLDNLETIVTKKQLSWAKLSRVSGLSDSHLASIRDGVVKPTIDTIEKLCIALDIEAVELFDRERYAIRKSGLICKT